MKVVDKLPEKFLFSQQSLSTFERCPMMFKKRYLENLRWDNVFDLEQKKAIERGKDFHLLARRYFLGVETDLKNLRAEDEKDEILDTWLCNLKQAIKLDSKAVYLPEHTIVMRSGKLRIQATLDLIISRKDSIEIWDWKTHKSLTQTDNSKTGKRLEKSLQTKVYLFMLREYAAKNNCSMDKVQGIELEAVPERTISMHYWQPEPPEVVISIPYDQKAHEENKQFLENRISDIEEYNWENFDKKLYSKHCRHCEFNWLCNGPAAVAGISTGEDDKEF